MNVHEIIGSVFIVIGSAFLFLGGLGVLRMPDPYNKLQAGTKASTLGLMSLALGIGIFHPAYLVKSILIIIFIAFTNPISSSIIAKSYYNFQKNKDKGE